MAGKKVVGDALTFDDVLLVPMRTEVGPSEIEVKTKLTNKIKLNVPIISAPMDTVTEAEMAIALAREGGIGVIHRNMTVEEQVVQIKRVKKAESWIVRNPVTVSPRDKLARVKELSEQHGFSSFPVVEGKKLVGIITGRDLRFEKDFGKSVSSIMTAKLITGKEGISLEEAEKIMVKTKIEKLPIVDARGNLTGLITDEDLMKPKKHPSACKDAQGRLLVGGAVGPRDLERAKALIEAEADFIVIDAAHGHSQRVLDAVKQISKWGAQVVGGNVVTKEGVQDLVSAGADAVKIGIGASAICTTRIVSGAGMPQLQAVMDCAEEGEKHNVPVIADGGIRYSGDIVKAIGAGAYCVMLGSLLAGTDETPGEMVFIRGRKYKRYRGMGSIGAMSKGSGDRYGFMGTRKFVPEGIEGIVPHRGSVSEAVYQLVGGLKSGMGYCGAKNIEELRKKAKFVKISGSGLRESHPHDIYITEEAPNYRMADLLGV
jgi:IMP dehydrogenase